MPAFVLSGGLELQKRMKELMSEGKSGAAAIRKGLRAGSKVVAQRVKADFPKLTGAAAKSVKVRAMKRKKGRIGVRVALYAASKKGAPYPYFLEGGVKYQKKGGRIRKTKNSTAEYDALSWKIRPQQNVKKSFEAVSQQALAAVIEGIDKELQRQAEKRG